MQDSAGTFPSCFDGGVEVAICAMPAESQAVDTGFGRRLRERRDELGLSGRKLAAIIDVDSGNFVRWESGDGYPKHVTLLMLARALHVPVGWLAAGEGNGILQDDVPEPTYYPSWGLFLETDEARAAGDDLLAEVARVRWPAGHSPTITSWLNVLQAFRSSAPRG